MPDESPLYYRIDENGNMIYKDGENSYKYERHIFLNTEKGINSLKEKIHYIQSKQKNEN